MIKELSQKVLKTIEERQITPRPRWTFLLKDYSIWFLGVLALLVGGLSFAVVIYMLRNNDWEVYRHLSGNLPVFVIATLPYFWLIFLAVFILAAHYNIKLTKTGYRYRLPAVIALSVLLSAALGGIFHAAGAGRAIDDILSQSAPDFYRIMVNRKLDMWAQPERGLLIGLVAGAKSREEFELIDFNRHLWTVSAKEAKIPPFLKIETGGRIKMIGQKTGESGFRALIIMPMGPGRGMFHHPGFRREMMSGTDFKFMEKRMMPGIGY